MGRKDTFCPHKLQAKALTYSSHEEKKDCSFGRYKEPGCQNKPVVEVKVGDTIIPTIVDTGCSQSMIWADFILAKLGDPETIVSMVYIYRPSYIYKHQQLRLMVLG